MGDVGYVRVVGGGAGGMCHLDKGGKSRNWSVEADEVVGRSSSLGNNKVFAISADESHPLRPAEFENGWLNTSGTFARNTG